MVHLKKKKGDKSTKESREVKATRVWVRGEEIPPHLTPVAPYLLVLTETWLSPVDASVLWPSLVDVVRNPTIHGQAKDL